MTTNRTNFDRHEARRDRRYALPSITVTLASGDYVITNWSLGGFLLPSGLDLAPGMPVAGLVTLPDGGTPYGFSADVVRRDDDGIGCRFVDLSDALVSALDRAIAHRLFRKRA